MKTAMVTASDHYYPIVKTACQLLRPAYIYERLCLGNWVAALLSRELQIPYIVDTTAPKSRCSAASTTRRRFMRTCI